MGKEGGGMRGGGGSNRGEREEEGWGCGGVWGGHFVHGRSS